MKIYIRKEVDKMVSLMKGNNKDSEVKEILDKTNMHMWEGNLFLDDAQELTLPINYDLYKEINKEDI